MNSRKAAAVAMIIIAIACRICGIFMSAMTVLLCFSGLTAKLQIVGFVVELSRALPSAIAGYGVITSPFGGVFRLDYAIVAVILFVIDYLLTRARAASARGGVMSSSYIMNLLASAVAVIVGIVIHESAHAAAAWALGDKTARSRGRVSLNPLNHIEPFGTIILPLLMLAAGRSRVRLRQARARLSQQPQAPQARRGPGERSRPHIEHRARVPGRSPHAPDLRQPLHQYVLCRSVANHELWRYVYRGQPIACVL